MSNSLTLQRRLEILNCLVHGCGIRQTAKIVGCHRDTVQRVLADTGDAAAKLFDKYVRNVEVLQLQADEFWGFEAKKEEKLWTAICMDARSRLVVSYASGARNQELADSLLMEARARTRGCPVLYTDGWSPYDAAREAWFGGDCAHGVLIKEMRGRRLEKLVQQVVTGDVDPAHISTSWIERINLTVRQEVSRAGRKTLKHTKKKRYHDAHLSLWFFVYNFIRPHISFSDATPAMIAGIEDGHWNLERMVLEGMEIMDVEVPALALPERHDSPHRRWRCRDGFKKRLSNESGIDDVEACINYLRPLIARLRSSEDLADFQRVSRGQNPLRTHRFKNRNLGGRFKIWFRENSEDGSVELSDIVREGPYSRTEG